MSGKSREEMGGVDRALLKKLLVRGNCFIFILISSLHTQGMMTCPCSLPKKGNDSVSK